MFGKDSAYIAAMAIQLLSAVLLTPVLTRVLGSESYGRFSAYLALLNVVTYFAMLGLSTGIQRVFAAPGGQQSSRRLLVPVLILCLLAASVALVTGPLWSRPLGFGPFGVPEALTVVAAGLAGMCWTAQALLRCNNRLRIFVVVAFLGSFGGQALGILLALVAGRSATHVLAGIAIMQVAGLAVALWTIRPSVKGLRDWGGLKALLRFSLPLMPQQIAVFVIVAADRFVVQSDLGPRPTGRYQVAYNVGAMAILVLTALNQAWLPRVFAETDRLKRGALLAESRDGLYVLLLPICLGLALGGPIALSIWAPKSFHTHGLIMVTGIVIVSTVPQCAALASTRAILAEGRSVTVAVATMIAAAVNLALNLVLVPMIGLDGSALATLASYVALAVAMTLLGGRRMGVPRTPLRLWAALGAVCAVVLLSWYIPTDRIGLVVRLAASLIALGTALRVLRRLATSRAAPSAANVLIEGT